jgi:FHS family L-fucose permease-like MFS transporter
MAAFVLTVALFFLWGVANNLNDILIAHFKAVFTLSDLGAGLIQSAFYLGYFCLAIPAALFMRAQGYRAAVILGLILYGGGALLFWPAAAMLSYPFFLCALFVIAAGLAFLETSANPLVARLGPESSASQRLSFAQAFNPLGSIAGVLVGRSFILSAPGDGVSAGLSPAALAAHRAAEAASVQMPYLLIGIGVLIWAVLIRVTPFPAVATASDVEDDVAVSGAFGSLIRTPRLMSGVAAQFFYVGAQVGVWSFLIRYAQVAMPGTAARTGATYLTISLVLFMIGRFIGAALMNRMRPLALLAIFAAIDAALCGFATIVHGAPGVTALVVSSFFMSIMYPTIFAESVAGLGERTKPASALLVMAIIGGAIFPAAMGYVSDRSGSIATAMLVPALCFVVVLAFGLVNRPPAA